eukprot:jgi/Galph1/4011/GphlegSOOS_G2704.1
MTSLSGNVKNERIEKRILNALNVSSTGMAFRGGRGGGRRGRFSNGDNRFGAYETPSQVIELGIFQHPCENELVCKSTNEKIPFFNAPIFLQNKTQIGKIEEIFGPITDVHFTVKPVDGKKLLPLERFLPKPPGSGTPSSGIKKRSSFGRGDMNSGGRGFRGRGGSRGRGRGRGNFRGGSFQRGRGR